MGFEFFFAVEDFAAFFAFILMLMCFAGSCGITWDRHAAQAVVQDGAGEVGIGGILSGFKPLELKTLTPRRLVEHQCFLSVCGC